METFPVDGPTPQCECTSNSGSGKPTYKGANCENWFEDYDIAPLVCADANYPTSGSCSYYTEGAWTCTGASLDCECEFTGERVDGTIRVSNCDDLGDIYACCPLCGSDGKCKMVCCGPDGCV